MVLRPSGVFYCSKYPSQASWLLSEGTITINWGTFGTYELTREAAEEGVGGGGGVSVGEATCFKGSLVGKPASWRTMTSTRIGFSEIETCLYGEGGGSVWSFIWSGGAFDVEFRFDGFQHFVCPQFPTHSHWSFSEDGQKVLIDFGKYGEFEMLVDASNKTMEGFKKEQPTNWRRATFIRSLGVDSLSTVPDHNHDHGGHVHTDSCKH